MSKRDDLLAIITFSQQEVSRQQSNLAKAEFDFIEKYAKFKSGETVLYLGKKYQILGAPVINGDLLYRLHAFTLRGDRPKMKEYYHDIYVNEAKLVKYADPKTSSQTSSGRSETVEH